MLSHYSLSRKHNRKGYIMSFIDRSKLHAIFRTHLRGEQIDYYELSTRHSVAWSTVVSSVSYSQRSFLVCFCTLFTPFSYCFFTLFYQSKLYVCFFTLFYQSTLHVCSDITHKTAKTATKPKLEAYRTKENENYWIRELGGITILFSSTHFPRSVFIHSLTFI